MSDSQIVMLVGCGIITLAFIPFASADYVASVGIVALGVTVFIIGALIQSRNGPPTA